MTPQPKPQRAEKPLRQRIQRSQLIPRGSRPARKKGPRKASRKRGKVLRDDATWRAAVFARTPGCEMGNPCCLGPHDPHHVLGKKAFPRLRHVPANGIRLCRFHHDWAHQHIASFRMWFAWYRPADWKVISELRKEAA